MNGNPYKWQQNFQNWAREGGCVISGCTASIHHIIGSKGKLKGCDRPGEAYILPLHYEYHQGTYGVHTNKRIFEERYGTEKELFVKLIEKYEDEFGHKPMSEEEYQIIIERA